MSDEGQESLEEFAQDLEQVAERVRAGKVDAVAVVEVSEKHELGSLARVDGIMAEATLVQEVRFLADALDDHYRTVTRVSAEADNE